MRLLIILGFIFCWLVCGFQGFKWWEIGHGNLAGRNAGFVIMFLGPLAWICGIVVYSGDD